MSDLHVDDQVQDQALGACWEQTLGQPRIRLLLSILQQAFQVKERLPDSQVQI